MGDISINYADYKKADVKRVTMVKSLLKDQKVVQFGEGNFTFTVALAAIRGGWDGIVSTRFESVPIPVFKEVKKDCIEFCDKNGKFFNSSNGTIKQCVEAVKKVTPPPQQSWLLGIDATHTPNDVIVKGKVAVFQCPWIADNDLSGTPGTLITAFLHHMSTKQNQGDYVLVGITKKFPYVKNYNLGEVLGEGLSKGTDKSGKYYFRGADETFIKEILKHGYQHMSCHSDADIHNGIIHDHITLVFQKK